MNATSVPRAPDDARLAASYDACRRMARRAGSSFYWSLWLLPPTQRQALFALYAFARHTDDITDDIRDDDTDDIPSDDQESRDTSARKNVLQRWRSSVRDSLASDGSTRETLDDDSLEQALLPALADTVRRCSIPKIHLESLFDGVTRDLDERNFADWSELRVYCEQVASSVGLACLHIWTEEPQAAYPAATECGIAFQLTNILRDLREDADRDRLYVPLDLLDQLHLRREELFDIVRESRKDKRYEQLIERLAARAERAYRAGWSTRLVLRGRSKRCFEMMFHTYHRLLGAIRRTPYVAATRRMRLSRPRKAWIALGVLCGVAPRFVDASGLAIGSAQGDSP